VSRQSWPEPPGKDERRHGGEALFKGSEQLIDITGFPMKMGIWQTNAIYRQI
jgi:hypothetical protein